MHWMIGVACFLAGMAVMMAVFAFGNAAKLGDESAERSAKYLADMQEAYLLGYRNGQRATQQYTLPTAGC